MSALHVLNHSAATALLTTARDRTIKPKDFADVMRRIGYILACEFAEGLQTKPRRVTTPLNVEAAGEEIDGRVAIVPVLRAGGSLEEGFRTILGDPRVWHLGLRRDERTLEPEEYRNTVPMRALKDVQCVVILEVMLATGGSACAAIDILKNRGNQNIAFVCVVAAPEGIARVQKKHPDVDIYVVAIDERLTTSADTFPPGYIWPGLGDAGDRINDTLEEE